jgi:hypothetical protein
VPRLLPRLTAAAFPAARDEGGERGQVLGGALPHHREYNSAMGAGRSIWRWRRLFLGTPMMGPLFFFL